MQWNCEYKTESRIHLYNNVDVYSYIFIHFRQLEGNHITIGKPIVEILIYVFVYYLDCKRGATQLILLNC